MIILPYTGERAVPWEPATGAHIMRAHVARYAWALQYAAGRRVVDLGCGAGYGAFMLSWVAESVLGVDVSAEAIAFARERFPAGNLRFEVADLTEGVPPVEHAVGADLYVAFEFLEHIDDPAALLNSLPAPLLWSIPIDDGSRYHKRPYTAGRIVALMGSIGWMQCGQGEIAPASIR